MAGNEFQGVDAAEDKVYVMGGRISQDTTWTNDLARVS